MMNSELVRLSTFTKWKSPENISILLLVRAGLYLDTDKKTIRCFNCNLSTQVYSKSLILHACSAVHATEWQQCYNLTVDKIVAAKCRYVHEYTTDIVVCTECHLPIEIGVMVANNKLWSNISGHMGNFVQRLQSFPDTYNAIAPLLATAGFAYCPMVKCKCFHCRVRLEDPFHLSDNLWTYHQRDCTYRRNYQFLVETRYIPQSTASTSFLQSLHETRKQAVIKKHVIHPCQHTLSCDNCTRICNFCPICYTKVRATNFQR